MVAPPSAAPAWKLATTTSASPLASSPSLSSAATRFTASLGSPKVMSSMPLGATSSAVSSVTAPTTATSTPSTVNSANSGRTGSVVPFS